MKRLILVVCALVIVLASGIVFPVTAEAAPKKVVIKSLDANSLMGIPVKTLTARYGKPARVEPSEYGFQWYVYNRDYKNFFMAGVKDGVVVASFTSAKTLNYRGQFKLNSTRAAVRARLGNPVSYIRSGNSISILSSANQRDFFEVGDNYVIVFYDNLKGGKVTSLMIVPKECEVAAISNSIELTPNLLAAYSRITVDLINATRARNGLRTLKVNAKMAKLALSRSTDMRNRDYFSHYTPQGVSPFTQAKKMGIKYRSFGENIAYGNHNAIFAHESFMNSAGHRSNILKSGYSYVGTGTAYGSSRYVLLSVEFMR